MPTAKGTLRVIMVEGMRWVPCSDYQEACDHVNHHEAQRRLAEGERDRAVETRENANAATLRVEHERDRLRSENEALKADRDATELAAAVGHDPLTCELCHAEGVGAELERLRAEHERLTEELAAAKRYGQSVYRVECLIREERDTLRPEVRRLRADNERLSRLLMKSSCRVFAPASDEQRLATCPCADPSPKGSAGCTPDRPCSYGVGMPRTRWGAGPSRDSEAPNGES